MSNIPENLYSIRAEANFLGSLIKNPKVLSDIEGFLTNKDFYHKVHSVVYSVLKSLVLSGQSSDKVILAQKCKELGLNTFEDLNLFEYLDSISFVSLNDKGTIELGKELIKLRIKRELFESANAVQSFIKESGEKSIDELIHGVDGIYNNKIVQYATDNEPKDLYSGIEELITTIAKNPIEESGLITPFKQFNSWFSGLISGDGVYCVAGYSGEGKSTFMFNMGKGVSLLNNCKTLILDTEMSIDMNMFRAASAEMQVNNFYLKTGQWIRNKELAGRVTSGFEKLRKYKGSIYHMYVPNKDIQEILSIAKRWYHRECGRGEKALIIYDYLKITSDLDKNRNEWQQLGDKVSYLNELGANLNVPIFTGAQQNNTSIGENGVRKDDPTTIGGSLRINQYACFNSIFREKTMEEISEHGGERYGTHILKPIKTSRTTGKDDYNSNRKVRVIDHQGKVKYRLNFINYEISNYQILERGTYSDVIKDQMLNNNLQKSKGENKEIII